MSGIVFTKVAGTGNDFVLLDNRKQALKAVIPDLSAFTQYVCRRKHAVGADGVLVLEDSKKADLKMRIFNPDGSEVTMCGNGARCAAMYAFRKQWCRAVLRVETGAGLIGAEVTGENVKLKMTDPVKVFLNKDLGIGKHFVKAHLVNTGVPHVVHFVEDVGSYPVEEMGRHIRYHKAFEPEGVNANFVQLIGEGHIAVRTYERGVEAETLACGTGSVAAAVIANLVNDVQAPVRVTTRSQEELIIHFGSKNGKISDVHLEGPAKIIFEGVIQYV